jgi:hypothetical protein
MPFGLSNVPDNEKICNGDSKNMTNPLCNLFGRLTRTRIS